MNIDELDPAAEGLPILLKKEERIIRTAMSNSFGFGGVNASIVFSKENL